MELKFNTIEELENFILKLGYVKLDEDEKPIVNEPLIIKTCPYGYTSCPYQGGEIRPYTPPLNTPIVTFERQCAQDNSTSGSVTVDMKDIQNNN